MLARTLSAIGEPHRLRMLEALREGPQSVATLSAVAGIAQPQTSKHLRVLRDAGLVGVTPDGQRRLYALCAEPLRELDEWLERYRTVLEANYARLEALLARDDDDRNASPTPQKKERTRDLQADSRTRR
ncbi:MAG: winged helix-turn-helix transcriptional regulator [Myxococcales bacterium]|nr:winged helix-turn-helix transcriptional regulator [Myxococcales bacterium]HRC55946.1 metalloregulator ArsR/SmtB family transcription factor [Kofleriaceae bacterium]